MLISIGNNNELCFAGDDALSEFGQEFLQSLEKCREDCAQKRDDLISKVEVLKEQNKDHVETMKQHFNSDSHQTSMNNNKSEVVRENMKESLDTRADSMSELGPFREKTDYIEQKSGSKSKKYNTSINADGEEDDIKDWNFSTTIERPESADKLEELKHLDTSARPTSPIETKSCDQMTADTMCTCGADDKPNTVGTNTDGSSQSKPPVVRSKRRKSSDEFRKNASRTKLVLKPRSQVVVVQSTAPLEHCDRSDIKPTKAEIVDTSIEIKDTKVDMKNSKAQIERSNTDIEDSFLMNTEQRSRSGTLLRLSSVDEAKSPVDWQQVNARPLHIDPICPVVLSGQGQMNTGKPWR